MNNFSSKNTKRATSSPPEFEECFKLLYEALCCFALRYTGQSKHAEDLVQDAFMSLWKQYNEFENFQHIKSFLYLTVRNSALNSLKHEEVKNKFLSVQNNEIINDDFDAFIIEEETYRIVHQLIIQLPNQTQKIILLALEANSNPEIAKKLNISVETVRTLKKRAYKVLREKLTHFYFSFLLLLTTLF